MPETGLTTAQQHIARPLMTPDEVRNLPKNMALLFLAGERPMLSGKLRYYAGRWFSGLFDGT
ncbi:MAG: type IV secretory system conjugative DNA transfer family protein [Mesorhizobium sp.]